MNIYDIAKEAGVSISTVSRVLNNKSNVKEDTKQKVEAVLEKHDYRPSAIARGLVSSSMRTVAVLTVDIRVPHYARTAYTIEREFSRRGYEVMLCNTGGELEEAAKYLRVATEKNVDGIVLVGSVFNTICKAPEIEGLLGRIPMVLANGKADAKRSYSVLVDDGYGVGLAVEHLVKRGCRDLYYLKDLDTASAQLKCKGFLEAAESWEAKLFPLSTDSGNVLENAYRAAPEILAWSPDAVICANDEAAVGIEKYCIEHGIRIPEDLLLTGGDNIKLSEYCQIPLTTFDQMAAECAACAVEILMKHLRNGSPLLSVEREVRIIQRRSTERISGNSRVE